MNPKQMLKTVLRRLASAAGIQEKLHGMDENIWRLIDRERRDLSYVDRGTQQLLAMRYRELAEGGVVLPFDDVEFRNHSQNGEDGLLWYVFSLIGTSGKRVAEICAGDGMECNSANLILNHGWTGVLLDGDEQLVRTGTAYYRAHPDTFTWPPRFAHAWVTAENVNDLLVEHGLEGEIDLLSLDLDGVDLWIWKAIEVVSPRVVIAEIQAIWGADRSVTVPYRPDFTAQFFNGFGIYSGASLPAFVKVGADKGYRLVGCQRYGFNAVFMRNDVGRDRFPEIPAADCFQHPFAHWAYDALRPMVADQDWQEV